MGMEDGAQKLLEVVISRVAEACKAVGVEFFIVGAYAQLLWLDEGNIASRGTRDVDVAVYVSDVEKFNALKSYLISKHGYTRLRENPLRLVLDGNYEIDLLPFNDETLYGTPRSIVSLVGVDFETSGIAAAFPKGLRVSQVGNTNFRSASMPALILMKLIAINERPEQRTIKDLSDILLVIKHYYSLELDAVFENHSDIYELTLTELQMSAHILGREIRLLIADQMDMLLTVQSVIEKLTEKTKTIVQAAASANLDDADVRILLVSLLKGLLEPRNISDS